MMMTELDVYLRGTRDYVQGTQILGRTADWLTTALADRSLELTSAKFTQLTASPVVAVLNGWHGETKDLTPIGSAKVRVAETEDELGIKYYSRANARASLTDDVPLRIGDLREEKRLGGRANFESDGGIEDLLAATVEMVKTLHSNLDECRGDIWFTSLGSATLPLARQSAATGTLIAEPQFERVTGGRLLTLTEITATGLFQPFLIGFSCRTS
jgi:hypothetical protein